MPDQIMKEVEFQQDKRKKRKFEAFEFNQLWGDEVDCNFEAEAEAFFEDRKKKHKQAESKRKHDKQKLCPEKFDFQAIVRFGVSFDVAMDQRQCILSGAVIANSRADASSSKNWI